jgi:hypothetical protein
MAGRNETHFVVEFTLGGPLDALNHGFAIFARAALRRDQDMTGRSDAVFETYEARHLDGFGPQSFPIGPASAHDVGRREPNSV